jgi:hypothetical protein
VELVAFMANVRLHAITGLIPPQVEEAKVRELWPSVARWPGVATLGRLLTRTIVLAPLAWSIMGAFYFGKLFPVFARRFTLTNRRLMIRKGWKGNVAQEVALADIDDVRVVTNANSNFFRSGNIEVISQGKVVMTLYGVPEPDTFAQAVLNTRNAWVPGKASTLPFLPASTSV